MSIEAQLNDLLKESMRTKDGRTADCIRMIKTKHMERRTAAGFKGPLDDALWLDVIATYQKQLRKSREEYAAIGARGAEAIPQIDFEIAFCAKFLPKAASDDEVRALVREALVRMGVSDPKQSGRVVGEIMKANKGKLEPAAVKRIVEEELTPPKT
ncbi:MAG TPA: GatB/YqeY domain-containing protein [Polyangia bacterium]|nr:GatB/YqeY domain-containing protein [Polyangia bacterium]